MKTLTHKFASVITAMVILFALCINVPVYAEELATAPSAESGLTNESDVAVPYGSLSGYGQIWHDPAVQGKKGSFTVKVSGIVWTSAQLTISLEDFRDDTYFDIWVFSPITNSNGENQMIFQRLNVKRTDGPWENCTFYPGSTGTYTVIYHIRDNGTNSSGRINCWVY